MTDDHYLILLLGILELIIPLTKRLALVRFARDRLGRQEKQPGIAFTLAISNAPIHLFRPFRRIIMATTATMAGSSSSSQAIRSFVVSPLHVHRAEPPVWRTSKKRVHFHRQKQVHFLDAYESTEECFANKWYSLEELSRMRAEAKMTTIRLRKLASLLPEDACGLTMAFRKTTLMLHSDLKSLVKLPPTTPEQDIEKWSSMEDGRRGLERFISQDYANIRKMDLKLSRTAVVNESHRQQANHEANPEALSAISRASTKRSRSFALFMGEADALVAGTSDTREPVRLLPPRKRSKSFHRATSPAA